MKQKKNSDSDTIQRNKGESVKESGAATFLFVMGIIVMALVGCGGIILLLDGSTTELGISAIIISLVMGSILIGLSEIINYQRKILIETRNANYLKNFLINKLPKREGEV